MAVSFKKNYMKNKLAMLAAAGLVAASVSVSKAQPYYVVGSYDSWANPSATAMTDNGPVGVNGSEEYSIRLPARRRVPTLVPLLATTVPTGLK